MVTQYHPFRRTGSYSPIHGSCAWDQSRRQHPKSRVRTISKVVSMEHRTPPKHHKSSIETAMLQAQVSRFPPNLGQVEYNGCRGIREGKMRAFKMFHSPPRGKRVDVSILTPARTRALRTPCLEHLPQVLPTSLWPVPPSTPTRRRGRGTSRDTSLLCPSLILRRRWARTPALFGLRPGPSWNEGFEGCWARLRLPKLLNHRLNGGTEKLGRRNRSIEQKAPLFPPDICQVHPQMSLRYHHGRHRPAHSSGGLLSGTESQICGAAQLSHFIRWQALTLIQVFQQISLVSLKHRHRVQRSNSLTCCCICLAI